MLKGNPEGGRAWSKSEQEKKMRQSWWAKNKLLLSKVNKLQWEINPYEGDQNLKGWPNDLIENLRAKFTTQRGNLAGKSHLIITN